MKRQARRDRVMQKVRVVMQEVRVMLSDDQVIGMDDLMKKKKGLR